MSFFILMVFLLVFHKVLLDWASFRSVQSDCMSYTCRDPHSKKHYFLVLVTSCITVHRYCAIRDHGTCQCRTENPLVDVGLYKTQSRRKRSEGQGPHISKSDTIVRRTPTVL